MPLVQIPEQPEEQPFDNNSWKYALFDVVTFIDHMIDCHIHEDDDQSITALEDIKQTILDVVVDDSYNDEYIEDNLEGTTVN